VKRPHRLSPIRIYLNRPIIYFRHCLYFNVIAPYSINPLPIYVCLEVLFTPDYKLNEKLSLRLDIVQAVLSDQMMMVLVAVVNLIGNSPK
jgi:hypothetical protein